MKHSFFGMVIFALFLTFFDYSGAAAVSATFEHITLKDGLPDVRVHSILQDKQGFMWFGTDDGLLRYDGYDFKIFQNDHDNPHSISGNSVYALFEDSKGSIWIGTDNAGLNRFDPGSEKFTRYRHNPNDPNSLSDDTNVSIIACRSGGLWISSRNGLNRFDPETETFTHYRHDPDNPNSLSDNSIFTLYEDRQGILWIGTWVAGLNRFDPRTGTFTRYQHDPADIHSLSNNLVSSIFEDKEGVLWIGTSRGGLHKFDREKEIITRYQHDPADPNSLGGNWILQMSEDKNGELWISTNGGGLQKYDRDGDRFIRYQHDPNDSYSIGSNKIWTIYHDSTGILWIGTLDAGVDKLDLGRKEFRHIRRKGHDPDSLISNHVTAIVEDRDGVLWFGTQDGLSRYDPHTRHFSHFQHDPNDPASLTKNSAFSLLEDRDGDFWVGLYGGSVNKFDRRTGKVTLALADPQYAHDPNDPHTIIWDSISVIYHDSTGALWFGTWGYGADKYDKRTGRFEHYVADPGDPASIGENTINDILEDASGRLWFATYRNGLSRFNREANDFTIYTHDPKDPQSLSAALVWCIHEDASGVLWVGTDGGLDKFDRDSGTFTHYRKKQGLAGNKVFGVLEDNQGNLWLSTNKGLSCFNPKKETFKNYDVADGLQGDRFLNFSYAKTRNGELYFGGGNGVTAFYPEDIHDNPHIPPIVITNFKMFNKQAPIGGDSILSQAINFTDSLTLSHKDDVISFEFAALSYTAPAKNKYMYKLDGFDEDWNEVDSRHRQAGYTNLPSGDYVFRVKGSNNDGLWNEEGASIRITVLPPWWETLWFRGGIVLLLIGLTFSGHRRRVRAIERYNRQLEGQVTERTADLRETTRALKTLLSNLPGIAYRCRNDKDWTMEFVSKGSKAITGYRASSLIGNKEIAFGDLIHSGDRETVWREVQTAVRKKKVFQIVYRIHDKAGALRWLWEQGQGIYDGEGRLLALEGLILDITQMKNSEEERENLIRELRQALAEVKILQGFIPICANCKSIRDDEGYWRDIEQYIQDHSDAIFSHGICPKCVEKLYPDFVDKITKPSVSEKADSDDE